MKKLFLLTIALFLCSESYCLNLLDAKAEVRRFIKDTATSASLQRYSEDDLNGLFNEAIRDVVTATWCLESSTEQLLSVGTTYYPLISDLINIKMVKFRDSTGRTRELTERSYKALRQNNPDYERISGPPMEYIIRASTSTSYYSQIAFLPIATTSSTGTVIIDYYKQATDITADSAILLDGDYNLIPYHKAVVYDVVSKIKLIEGDISGAAAFSALYEETIKNMNSRLGERPNFNPGLSAGTPR